VLSFATRCRRGEQHWAGPPRRSTRSRPCRLTSCAARAWPSQHARAAASLLTTLEDTLAPDRGVAEQQLLTAHLRDLVRREQQCLAAKVMTATPNGGPAAMRASPGRRE